MDLLEDPVMLYTHFLYTSSMFNSWNSSHSLGPTVYPQVDHTLKIAHVPRVKQYVPSIRPCTPTYSCIVMCVLINKTQTGIMKNNHKIYRVLTYKSVSRMPEGHLSRRSQWSDIKSFKSCGIPVKTDDSEDTASTAQARLPGQPEQQQLCPVRRSSTPLWRHGEVTITSRGTKVT